MDVKADIVNRLVVLDTNNELVQCPNCAHKLKPNEVAQHCEEEMVQLQCMPLKKKESFSGVEESTAESTDGAEERRKPWTVFQKVQRNRHSRLKQRTRKRPFNTAQERTCPICNKNFAQEDIEYHVEDCLKRSKTTNEQNRQSSSDEDDVGEEFEEYEWAGQKRIRVSSLLQGGYAAFGIGQTIINTNGNGNGRQDADEDEDLNVDEDDTHIYGPPQYEESDIISPDIESRVAGANDEEDVTSYMRKLITAGSSNCLNGEREKERTERIGVNDNDEMRISEAATSSNGVNTVDFLAVAKKSKSIAYEQIIASLKAKLRQYEQQQQSKFKCLICLDEYRKPTISVSCWHVHCEDCWLRSLGTRKLCPQCNLITTPKDLRRIYM